MREIILTTFYHRNRSRCLVNAFRSMMIIYCNVTADFYHLDQLRRQVPLRQTICGKSRLIVEGAIMRSHKMTA